MNTFKLIRKITSVITALIIIATISSYTTKHHLKTTPPLTALTAVTRFVEVKGIKIAYRRFGKKEGIPLVLIQHFTGTLENWDPLVLDGLAKTREVIIFDNNGIAGSGGITPDNIADNAKDIEAFISALGLTRIDLLGYSMGGFMAQQVVLDKPQLVNKLLLIATAPKGGQRIETFTPQVWALFEKKYAHPDELLLETLFTPSTESQKAGNEFLSRIRSRVVDRDLSINDKVAPAQVAAISGWAKINPGNWDYLKAIKQPTLIVVGQYDIIFPPENSYILQQHLPNAQLIVFPDANHGALYQFPNLFVQQVTLFLKGVQ